jgi:hypothetical protein
MKWWLWVALGGGALYLLDKTSVKVPSSDKPQTKWALWEAKISSALNTQCTGVLKNARVTVKSPNAAGEIFVEINYPGFVYYVKELKESELSSFITSIANQPGLREKC